MPRGDGTGPNGQGPRSGRGMGPCNGSVEAGFQQPAGGRFGQGFRHGFGRGRGYGGGRGFGRGFGFGRQAREGQTAEGFPMAEPPMDQPTLERLDAMQRQLEALHRQIADLKAAVTPSSALTNDPAEPLPTPRGE